MLSHRHQSHNQSVLHSHYVPMRRNWPQKCFININYNYHNYLEAGVTQLHNRVFVYRKRDSEELIYFCFPLLVTRQHAPLSLATQHFIP